MRNLGACILYAYIRIPAFLVKNLKSLEDSFHVAQNGKHWNLRDTKKYKCVRICVTWNFFSFSLDSTYLWFKTVRIYETWSNVRRLALKEIYRPHKHLFTDVLMYLSWITEPSVIEDDILGDKRSGRNRRAATSIEKKLWPGGVIPYVIADSFTSEYNHLVETAVSWLPTNTAGSWDRFGCIINIDKQLPTFDLGK